MQAGQSPARQSRMRYRHELRALAYVTLDQANGGIVRNVTHDGIAVQAVTSVLPRQQLRVRFELRYPRLRVDTRGEVVWATFSGRCGIRFLDLPPQTVRQIDEWIFGNLLEGLSLPSDLEASIFTGHALPQPNSDTLQSAWSASPSARISPGAPPPLRIAAEPEAVPTRHDWLIPPSAHLDDTDVPLRNAAREIPGLMDPDWFSQPLSGRSLVWTVNALVVFAALLLFAVVFLFVTREAPQWPATTISGAAIAVTTLYWGFFRMFGGSSLGVRLARLSEGNAESDDSDDTRFR